MRFPKRLMADFCFQIKHGIYYASIDLCTLYDITPSCAKTAKYFTKRFYDSVSSFFAVILAGKNQRYHLQRGQGVPFEITANEM